jgi:hypothetical protein
VQDFATRTVLLRTLRHQRTGAHAATTAVAGPGTAAGLDYVSALADPTLGDIAVLRSKDRARVVKVLRREEGLPVALVAHVIPLLAWDAVAEDAVTALRKVSEERIGELVDALIDPNQPFAVRRRLARAFSVCVSQRAVDGLFLGLDDLRFEVRFQCGRSLAAIHERNPLTRIDRDRVLEVVRREVAVSRPVWESHRLLDRIADPEPKTFVDDFLKDRAGQSLAHVFALLSLVLPAEPLRIAYRGLHAADENLRGTALEYLDGVLPPAIRERLWPFLDNGRPAARTERPREQILADLFRLNQSVELNIEEFKQRAVGPEV